MRGRLFTQWFLKKKKIRKWSPNFFCSFSLGNKCSPCTIPFCKSCDNDGKICSRCEEGHFLFDGNNDGIIDQCSNCSTGGYIGLTIKKTDLFIIS